MPQLNTVYKDKILTNVSVKYTNKQNFIADVVAPVLPVDDKTGVYFVYDKDNIRKPVSSKTTGRSLTPEVDYGLSQVPYGPLTRRRLKKFIDTDEAGFTQSPADAEQDATEFLTEQLAIEREIELRDAMKDAAIVTESTTLSGTSQWSDAASNPIKAIKNYITTMKLKGLIAPNTLVIGQQVWDVISEHAAIVERIKYTSDQPAQLGIVARLVGLEQIILGESVCSDTAEGLATSNQFIWGKDAWLIRKSATPGLKEVSAFYQLALKGARGVHKWYQEDPEGTYVRITDYYDLKLMAAEGVYGIYNAVA